jgi:hypothetical protein
MHNYRSCSPNTSLSSKSMRLHTAQYTTQASRWWTLWYVSLEGICRIRVSVLEIWVILLKYETTQRTRLKVLNFVGRVVSLQEIVVSGDGYLLENQWSVSNTKKSFSGSLRHVQFRQFFSATKQGGQWRKLTNDSDRILRNYFIENVNGYLILS